MRIEVFKNTFIWKPRYLKRYFSGSKSHVYIFRWLWHTVQIHRFPKKCVAFRGMKLHYYAELNEPMDIFYVKMAKGELE